MRLRLALLVLFCVAPACGGDDGPTITIYTSIYKHVCDDMQPVLEARFPGVRFEFFQKGSEVVGARLNAELATGTTECDLLLTSDPFHYAQLKAGGHLLPYETDATRDVPDELKDPDHAFATVRIPLMVLAVNEALDTELRPYRFQDLGDPKLKGQVTIGDPLKSGTNFTTVAALTSLHGWAYYETLRDHDVFAEGGNSAVLRRLESGERYVGVILLENMLARLAEVKGRDYPVQIVYPADGAIPIPSPAAILRYTEEPELAKEVFDFLFSKEIQDLIVGGYMYSPIPGIDPPANAPRLAEVALFAWTNAFVDDVTANRDALKRRWREVMR